MTKQRGRWLAACVGVVAVVLVAALLWSSREHPPETTTPDGSREPPAPEPLPDGTIRGVCGFAYSGGPPPPPGGPQWGGDSPRDGIPVEVRELDGGKPVAAAVSQPDGRFEVRVRPGAYRVVAVYWTTDAFGRMTTEEVVRLEPGKSVEVRLFQSVLVP